MEEQRKRERGSNFTSEDKLKLIDIIQSKPVINCKKTDGTTNKTKEAAWEDVVSLFNASSIVKRNSGSLQKCYNKLKTDAKLYKSKQRHCITATGGGIANIKDNLLLERVLNMIGRAGIGISNVTDSDDPAIIILPYNEAITVEVLPEPSPTSSSMLSPIVSPLLSPRPVDIATNSSVQNSEDTSPSGASSFLSRRRPALKRQVQDRLLEAKLRTEELKCKLLQDESDDSKIKRRAMEEEHALKQRRMMQDIEIRDLIINKIKNNEEVQPELINLLK